MLSYLKTQYNVTDYSEHGSLENIEAILSIIVVSVFSKRASTKSTTLTKN